MTPDSAFSSRAPAKYESVVCEAVSALANSMLISKRGICELIRLLVISFNITVCEPGGV
jgi:hypothetical protein